MRKIETKKAYATPKKEDTLEEKPRESSKAVAAPDTSSVIMMTIVVSLEGVVEATFAPDAMEGTIAIVGTKLEIPASVGETYGKLTEGRAHFTLSCTCEATDGRKSTSIIINGMAVPRKLVRVLKAHTSLSPNNWVAVELAKGEVEIATAARLGNLGESSPEDPHGVGYPTDRPIDYD